jgi:hypothetical protein
MSSPSAQPGPDQTPNDEAAPPAAPETVEAPPEAVEPSPETVEPSPEAIEPPETVQASTETVEPSPETVEPSPEAVEPSPEAPEQAPPAEQQAPAKKAGGKKGKGKGAAAAKGPTPDEITRRIGGTNEKALAYVLSPDPKLSRLSRKAREALLPDLPPVVAGALLGPAALARHFIAYASYGRYRDLFSLWELFRQRPTECKPVLAERQPALDKARDRLRTAIRVGLTGRADRAAEDVRRAEGLIWQWVREPLMENLPLVGMRPEIATKLLEREPDLEIPLPATPDARWLDEAAAARRHGPLPPALDALLAANIDRLPATVATLGMAQDHYPERVVPLLDHVNLDGPEIGSVMAWARDHGHAERLHARIRERVQEAAQGPRAEALAVWQAWRERGVEIPLPEALRVPNLEGLDLTKPESAILIAALQAEGADLQPQRALDDLAAQNRQLAEKAYESFVCADLPVTLPAALRGNVMVKEGTRCPACEAWTWVRPGHERRCPRLAAMPPEPAAQPAAAPAEHTAADDWEAAAQGQQTPSPQAEASPSPPAQPAPEAAATAPQQVAAAAAQESPAPAPSAADEWEAAARDAALAEADAPAHGGEPVDPETLPAAAPEPMPASTEPAQPAPGPAPAAFSDPPDDAAPDDAAPDEATSPPDAGAGA